MVEAAKGLAPFTTINYVKDGEKISATKQDSVVTLVGDKNGTRQMPLDEFTKNELPNAKDIKLERAPEKDTVEIAANKLEEKPVPENEKVANVNEAKPDTKADAPKEPQANVAPEPKVETGKKLNIEV